MRSLVRLNLRAELTLAASITSRKLKTDLDKTRAEHQAQNAKIQTYSNSIHTSEMELASKRQDVKEKEQLEQQQRSERDEVQKMQADLKVSRSPLRTETISDSPTSLSGAGQQAREGRCSHPQARG